MTSMVPSNTEGRSACMMVNKFSPMYERGDHLAAWTVPGVAL